MSRVYAVLVASDMGDTCILCRNVLCRDRGNGSEMWSLTWVRTVVGSWTEGMMAAADTASARGLWPQYGSVERFMLLQAHSVAQHVSSGPVDAY
jgi:hypothetical protein